MHVAAMVTPTSTPTAPTRGAAAVPAARRCCVVRRRQHPVAGSSGGNAGHTPRRRNGHGHGSGAAAAAAAAAATEAATAPPQASAANNMPSAAARAALFGTAAEVAQEVEASVTGELPAWLRGSLVVNGGGDYPPRMAHMFDGYGLLSKLRLGGDGRAWGSQRYLRSRARAAYEREGRVVFQEFAARPETDGWLGWLRELAAQLYGLATKRPTFTDNASVSLQPVQGGRLLLAMSETPAASYLVDPQDLSTVRPAAYDDGVPGDLTTAHPSRLPDGAYLNFTRSLPLGGFHLFRQDPDTLRRTQIAFVPDRRPLEPAWLHDFAATARHAVIIEQPLYMSLASLLLGTPASHVFMNWAPQDGVRVHVVPLGGSGSGDGAAAAGPVRTFTCPSAFFFFHVGNAFESDDGRYLHVDLAAYDDPAIVNDLALGLLREPPADAATGALRHQVSRSSYRRLTIPLSPSGGGDGGGVLDAPAPLVPAASDEQGGGGGFCEFPAVSPGVRGRDYRYAYCLAAKRPTNMGNALAKLDLRARTEALWHAPGGAVGEPVFVPRPGSSGRGDDEDDGVVLAPGIDAEGHGMLVVLDARRWQELARVTLPFAVPNRFHGVWLPAEEDR